MIVVPVPTCRRLPAMRAANIVRRNQCIFFFFFSRSLFETEFILVHHSQANRMYLTLIGVRVLGAHSLLDYSSHRHPSKCLSTNPSPILLRAFSDDIDQTEKRSILELASSNCISSKEIDDSSDHPFL